MIWLHYPDICFYYNVSLCHNIEYQINISFFVTITIYHSISFHLLYHLRLSTIPLEGDGLVI